MITLALALCTETVQTLYFQGALNLQDEVLEGDKVYNAQFGAAIAAVGDLNQDGFQGKLSNLSLLEERQSSRAARCLISQARFSNPGTLNQSEDLITNLLYQLLYVSFRISLRACDCISLLHTLDD